MTKESLSILILVSDFHSNEIPYMIGLEREEYYFRVFFKQKTKYYCFDMCLKIRYSCVQNNRIGFNTIFVKSNRYILI